MKLTILISKVLSDLQEVLDDQCNSIPEVKTYFIILEDIRSLLEESLLPVAAEDKLEERLPNKEQKNEQRNEDIDKSSEEYITQSLLSKIQKEMISGLEACKSISVKQKSGKIKKIFLFIKDQLLDNPYQILNAVNTELWYLSLNARIQLKDQNFLINLADIVKYGDKQLKVKREDKKRIEDIEEEEQIKIFVESMKPNIIYDVHNQNGKNAGEIIDLPHTNNCSPQKNIIRENKMSSIHWKLTPFADQKLDITKELDKLVFEGDLLVEQDSNSAQDIFCFQRKLFTEPLKNSSLLCGRISRNHATLRIKIEKGQQPLFYLVNHSPNGCIILDPHQKELQKLKDMDEIMKVEQNGMIGLLFDNEKQELLIGFNLTFTS